MRLPTRYFSLFSSASHRKASLRMILLSIVLFVIAVAHPQISPAQSSSKVQMHTTITHYVPPRPPFDKLHIAMSRDSAFLVMRHIALRMDTLHVDSLLLLESDSVMVFGQPAYIQLQLLHDRVRTIVINWHPLSGDRYTGLRDVLDDYFERYFGRGVPFTRPPRRRAAIRTVPGLRRTGLPRN